jgi:glycerol-3-phosphate acyltransferase PlsY
MKTAIPVIVIIVSYLFASIPWGLLIGKLRGIDIRKHGSGNIGATNVTRTVGKGWGRLCFLLDFLKGLLPILAVRHLIAQGFIDDPYHIVLAATALACVAGHMWSIYIGFKGGKGISTTAGLLLALVPYSLIPAAALWVIVFYTFRYVSLASICAAIFLPLAALTLSLLNIQPRPASVLVLLFFLGALAVFRHRDNISRLMNGTESRFDKKKKNGVTR